MVNLKTTKAEWVEAAWRLVATEGVEAVGAESLASSLDVTKGGFYGYFRNRTQFLAELLETWEHEVTVGITRQVGNSGDPRERVAELFRAVEAQEQVARSVETELAIRAWALSDTRAKATVLRVERAQAAFLHSLFREFCTDREAKYRTIVAMSVRLATPFSHLDRELSDTPTVKLVLEELLR